jgi:UPF0755 protein
MTASIRTFIPAVMTARIKACMPAVLTAVMTACGDGGDGPPARVTVPVGATMRSAADSLASAGVIGSPKAFRLYAKLRRGDRAIKAGTYELKKNASWASVLASLRSGQGIVNTVTVPEGFTLAQTEALLASRLSLPIDSVKAATRDSALLRRLRVGRPDLEGYLFPDTYFFPPGTTARAAVQAMVRRFEQRWKPEWTARLDTFALSRHELITLASIVEREARLPQERPIIAGVYWNRLRRGMMLQADPTVQYALPQYQARLLYRHLSVRSPYNTYRYRGLPPGPIAAPGEASIVATLFPDDVKFLYFVAYPDGHHEFRETAAEHEKAVVTARRAWNAVRTKAAGSSPTR